MYLPLLIAFSSVSDINPTLKIGITIGTMKFYIALRYGYNIIMMLEKDII